MATLIQKIEERVVEGRRLGRHVAHDEASRQYKMVERLPVDVNKALVDKRWNRHVDPFDQGNLGSCTGNGALGLLATDPFYTPGTTGAQNPNGTVVPNLAEQEAVQIYGEATQLDGMGSSPTDYYPPDDRGSSVLAAMKALQHFNLIKSYSWGFSTKESLACLSQYGPVDVGFNWYDSFDSPDSAGLVTLTASSSLRGGHSFDLIGIDAENKRVWAANSWGLSWGIQGTFCFSWDDLDRLINEQGEAVTLEV